MTKALSMYTFMHAHFPLDVYKVFVPRRVYYEQRFVNFRTQQQKVEEFYEYHNQSIEHTG